jgi:hypothetical protein
MRSIWDGVYTNAQADRGKALYSNYCAMVERWMALTRS